MRTGAIVGALLVVLAGCDRSDINDYSCLDPDKGHLDAERKPDPCHLHDPDSGAPADAGPSADGGDTCGRLCLPHSSPSWFGPVLLWTGAEADAPDCASFPGNLIEAYNGHVDLKTLPTCGACTCATPTGSCALPATLSVSSKLCADDGSAAVHTSFDPPASWGGTCTAANAIPAGQLCGGAPCVQSVTIAPLTLTEGCEPIKPAGYQTPAIWGTFARACSGEVEDSRCKASGDGVCVAAAPGPEFKQCVYKEGEASETDDFPCPAAYTEKVTFYGGVAHDACTPCSCAPPQGSTCSGSISISSDGACGSPLFSATLAATGSQCHDFQPPGIALGSKEAGELSYSAGTCKASGGELLLDKVVPTNPTTFCCLSTP